MPLSVNQLIKPQLNYSPTTLLTPWSLTYVISDAVRKRGVKQEI
jgi:hypothetical protein